MSPDQSHSEIFVTLGVVIGKVSQKCRRAYRSVTSIFYHFLLFFPLVPSSGSGYSRVVLFTNYIQKGQFKSTWGGGRKKIPSHTFYKHFSLYPQIGVVFTPHQGGFSLQMRRPLQKTTNNQHPAWWSPAPANTSKAHSGNIVKGYGKIIRTGISGGFALRLFLTNIRCYIHKIWLTRLPSQTWGEQEGYQWEIPQDFNPTQRTTSNRVKQGPGEVVLLREEHADWLSSA